MSDYIHEQSTPIGNSLTSFTRVPAYVAESIVDEHCKGATRESGSWMHLLIQRFLVLLTRNCGMQASALRQQTLQRLRLDSRTSAEEKPVLFDHPEGFT